jgi:hypothetical protein
VALVTGVVAVIAALNIRGVRPAALLLLVFAFTGFETGTVPAGEVRDPRRNLPFAILTAMAVIVPLYILVQVVCIGARPGRLDHAAGRCRRAFRRRRRRGADHGGCADLDQWHPQRAGLARSAT